MKDKKGEFAGAIASYLSSLSEEQQKELFQNSRIDASQIADQTRAALLSGLAASESPLKAARRAINERATEKVRRFSDSIADPKGYIIDLMTSGRLPPDLTLAFREGEDFSDEDLRSLIDDLEYLNDIDDEH